jgi:uncharacterized protein (TIGR02301 family)
LVLGLTVGLSLLIAVPADAQARGPEAHKQLLELAGVLGQAHALRQACAPDDQTWRSRMQRMIEVEAPDQTFEAELTTRFNQGFMARKADFPHCDPRAAREEAKVAARGEALAKALAQVIPGT